MCMYLHLDLKTIVFYVYAPFLKQGFLLFFAAGVLYCMLIFSLVKIEIILKHNPFRRISVSLRHKCRLTCLLVNPGLLCTCTSRFHTYEL